MQSPTQRTPIIGLMLRVPLARYKVICSILSLNLRSRPLLIRKYVLESPAPINLVKSTADNRSKNGAKTPDNPSIQLSACLNPNYIFELTWLPGNLLALALQYE